MPIVSLSLDKETLNELDKIQNFFGFKGRSQTVKAAIRELLTSNKSLSVLSGEISAVIIVIHSELIENKLTELKHLFDEIILSQLHNKLDENDCIDIFMLKGSSKQIKKMYSEFQQIKKISYLKLFIA